MIEEPIAVNITRIMTTKLVTIDMDDNLGVIKEIFDNVCFRHLLVTEGNKLYGVVSDRDLLKELSPNLGTAAETAKDLNCLQKKAHQIMSRNPITLANTNNVFDAIDLFNQHRISCLPVVNDQFEPIGIISWRDILRVAANKKSR